ncbi:DUF6193 family natural product biosynthesis protein [Streptomyces sp. WM6378]|uniref:DUF6193 family natural product biosynthesis protein n=1 Tax=Streptomyces sp. WM6378 TaxID=1415557 RepID=UPI001F2623FC|nr:DUF6193 family natural product biosynthesis protein [Streptomyces sp. WM6378]
MEVPLRGAVRTICCPALAWWVVGRGPCRPSTPAGQAPASEGQLCVRFRTGALLRRRDSKFELVGPDPVRRVESEWQHLRLEASELSHPWAPAYRSLIEAAYAELTLRTLYPFTSHWALRFSTTTRPDLNPTGPCLTANSDGTFGVGRGFLTPDLGLFATPGEAVARAVRELSPGPSQLTDRLRARQRSSGTTQSSSPTLSTSHGERCQLRSQSQHV